MPSVYIFTDLDDTLFQTRRKCPPGDCTPVAVDRQGNPLSFATPQQQALIGLVPMDHWIPVTGRNTAALERVSIPFRNYRITSHGILVTNPDGQPDDQWLTHIADPLQRWMDQLDVRYQIVQQLLDHMPQLGLRCKLVEDQGQPVYLSIKGKEAALQTFKTKLPNHWDDATLHHNGENLALLPRVFGKSEAVDFVMTRLREQGESPLYIGIGDSQTDLPFLQRCHYAMIPQYSQIQHTW